MGASCELSQSSPESELTLAFTISLKGSIPPVAMDQEVSQKIEALINDFLDLILKYALENLAKNESWVTGHLAKSGRVEVKKNKDLIEGELLFGAPYASAVEFGTRPHVAPLGPSLAKNQTSVPDPTSNPLDFWAWRKGEKKIIPCRIGKRFYGFHTSLGWGVWRKIMGRGADPHPYLRPAIAKAEQRLPGLIEKHLIGVK